MPGNIVINKGGTMYEIVQPKLVGSATGEIYIANLSIVPNQYYQLCDVVNAYVTLSGDDKTSYNEYMFEVAFTNENPRLRITSEVDLYWPREVTAKGGYRYQFSILNGIVLWTEVPAV